MLALYYRVLPLLLSPLLLIQALKVKASTLRLPEPKGVRYHQAAASQSDKTLSVLIIGDSAAAGVGASHQQQALSGAVATRLNQHFNLEWRLHARSGLATKGAFRWLDKLPEQHFDVVVISLGVNDIFSPISQRGWLRLQQQFLQQIQSRLQPQLVILTAVPPLEHFSALPQPLRYCMGLRAKLFNQGLMQQVKRNANVMLLAIPNENGQLSLAQDGFHPSEASYQIWAEAIASACKKHFNVAEINQYQKTA